MRYKSSRCHLSVAEPVCRPLFFVFNTLQNKAFSNNKTRVIWVPGTPFAWKHTYMQFKLLKTANVSFFNHEAKPGKNHQIRADEFSGVKCSKKLGHVGSTFWTKHVLLGEGSDSRGPYCWDILIWAISNTICQAEWFHIWIDFEIFSQAMEFSFCFHIQNFVAKNPFTNNNTILAYNACCQQNLTRNLDRWQQLASNARYIQNWCAVKSQTFSNKLKLKRRLFCQDVLTGVIILPT